jgi:hypothetical protein
MCSPDIEAMAVDPIRTRIEELHYDAPRYVQSLFLHGA